MDFKMWSQISQEAKTELAPDLGIRNIDQLNQNERQNLYAYLVQLFIQRPDISYRIENTIHLLNEIHKSKSPAQNYLRDPSRRVAEEDFNGFLIRGSNNLVLEAISMLCSLCIKKDDQIFRVIEESAPDYESRKIVEKYELFDEIGLRLNEIFEDFGLDVLLTREGFVYRHDTKLIDLLYIPVISSLSHKQWEPVNRELHDAFEAFRQMSPKGYSKAITHCHNALEGLLQIKVHGKTGTGTLGQLVKDALSQGLIPKDYFSREILGGFKSMIQQSRIKSGDGHTKEEYATQEQALLIMDVTMVALRHCLTG